MNKLSKLTARSRSHIKQKNFGIPDKAETPDARKKSGNYPIHDRKHARSALAYGSRFLSADKYAALKARIYAKYPDMKKTAAEHIFITGHSGAGKSTLAQDISEKQGIPRYNMDMDPEILGFWDSKGDHSPIMTEEQSRDKVAIDRKVIKKIMALKTPHVADGTQILNALDMLKGTKHRKILVNPSEDEVVKRRLGRDVKRGKISNNPSEADKAERIQMAKNIMRSYKKRISKVQKDPEWEKVAAEMIHYVPADAVEDVEKEGIKPVGRLSGEYGRKLLKRYGRFTGREDADLKEILRAVRRFRQHKQGENAVFGFPGPVDVSRHERLKDWLRDKVPYRINVDKLKEDGLLLDAQNLDAPPIDYDKIPKVGPVLADIPHPRVITKGGIIPPKYLEKASAEKVLYHGSPHKLRLLRTLNKHGDPGIDKAVFASPSKATALAYLAPWTDKDIMQMGLNGEYIIGESRPGAFKELFNKPGYLHEVPADTFKPLKGRDPKHELVSYTDVKPMRVKKIKNILKALRDEGIKTVPYDRNSKYYKAFVRAKVKRLRNMDKGDNKMYMNWLMDGENPLLAEDIRKAQEKL